MDLAPYKEYPLLVDHWLVQAVQCQNRNRVQWEKREGHAPYRFGEIFCLNPWPRPRTKVELGGQAKPRKG